MVTRVRRAADATKARAVLPPVIVGFRIAGSGGGNPPGLNAGLDVIRELQAGAHDTAPDDPIWDGLAGVY
jgi:hypothetical protein